METIEERRNQNIPKNCPQKAEGGEPVFDVIFETMFKKTYICTNARDDSDICPTCPFYFGLAVEK